MSLKKTNAWKECSAYILERDGRICFTCGKEDWRSKMMHAGHMIQGYGHAATFFLEINLHAQCYNCNVNGYGMNALYKQKFIEKYGEEEYGKVKKLSNETKQHTPQELKEIAKKYREKYKLLIK